MKKHMMPYISLDIFIKKIKKIKYDKHDFSYKYAYCLNIVYAYCLNIVYAYCLNIEKLSSELSETLTFDIVKDLNMKYGV